MGVPGTSAGTCLFCCWCIPPASLVSSSVTVSLLPPGDKPCRAIGQPLLFGTPFLTSGDGLCRTVPCSHCARHLFVFTSHPARCVRGSIASIPPPQKEPEQDSYLRFSLSRSRLPIPPSSFFCNALNLVLYPFLYPLPRSLYCLIAPGTRPLRAFLITYHDPLLCTVWRECVCDPVC